MNKDEDGFKTKIEGGLFEISVEQESDYSSDGGYNFEMVTNTITLNKEDAKKLMAELFEFLGA